MSNTYEFWIAEKYTTYQVIMFAILVSWIVVNYITQAPFMNWLMIVPFIIINKWLGKRMVANINREGNAIAQKELAKLK